MKTVHLKFVPKLCLLIILTFPAIAHGQKIFPGAMGFGTETRGAYAGSSSPAILTVDTLYAGNLQTSSSSGSLQWCLQQSFPRIIIFKVGGVIDYSNTNTRYIRITNPYLNIYGQTAPHPGITIVSCAIYTYTHDILMQHIKIRYGDKPTLNGIYEADDCLTINEGSENVVIDHCSFSWSQDELVGVYGANVTFSNNLMYEPLHYSVHADEGGSNNPEPHGFGPLVSTSGNFSFFRNFLGWTVGRNPHLVTNNFVNMNNMAYSYALLGSDISGNNGISNGCVVGNVNYPTNSQNDSKASYSTYLRESVLPTSRIYYNDNKCIRKDAGYGEKENIFTYNKALLDQVVVLDENSSVINLDGYEILPSNSVEAYLINNAGAHYWERDYYDKQALAKLSNREQDFVNSPEPMPARAYNMSPSEGWHTRDGNMINGYDFSVNPATFTVNGKTINLTSNLTSQAQVLNALNQQLPAGYVAIDHPHSKCQHIIIQSTAKGSSASLTVSGDGLRVFGIYPGTYNGSDGLGGYPKFQKTEHQLIIPANPHTDSNGNGFTNLEEWVAEMKNYGNNSVENRAPSLYGLSGTIIVNEDESRVLQINDLNVNDPDDNKESLSVNILPGEHYSINGTTIIPDANFYGNLNVEIFVRDGKGLASNHIIASITVNSINDSPVISNQDFTIYEKSDMSQLIGKIQAVDLDINQNMTFFIKSGNDDGLFNIESSTGNIFFSTLEIDFGSNAERVLIVEVKDNGNPSLSATASITIHLITDKKVFYIDPDNLNDPLRNGSIMHPYSSWLEVKWQNDAMYFQKSGTTANLSENIIINADNVFLGSYGDGQKPKISNNLTSEYAIRSANIIGLHIKDLEIEAENAIACLYAIGSSTNKITVENCRFTNANYGILVRDIESLQVSRSVFDNHETGILVDALFTEISYNNFSSLQSAIEINGSGATSKIYNNDFYDNNLCINASNTEMLVYNNIFYLSQTDAMALLTSSDRFLSDHNIYYPDKTGLIRVEGITYNSLSEIQLSLKQDINSLIENPLFKDAGNNNFEIEHSSPAIDAGINVGLLEDLYGMTVPKGKAPDIGSFEAEEQISSNIEKPITMDQPWLIYPNPARSEVFIEVLDQKKVIKSLELINYAGNVVYTRNCEAENVNGIQKINLYNQSPGAFLVKANFSDGKTEIQKLTILK